MDESSAECETVFVVEYCESEMFVVSNAMTHTEHVGCDVFCSSYWKKDVKFWLLTVEASDFYLQPNMPTRVDTGNKRWLFEQVCLASVKRDSLAVI